MTAQSALGELVNALVGGASTGLDHVEDPSFVGGESGDLAGDLAAEGGALADFLFSSTGIGKGGGMGQRRSSSQERVRKGCVKYEWIVTTST